MSLRRPGNSPASAQAITAPAGFGALRETPMLLILAIVLLIIAIAGGVIVHPLLFALAIVALILFFQGR